MPYLRPFDCSPHPLPLEQLPQLLHPPLALPLPGSSRSTPGSAAPRSCLHEPLGVLPPGAVSTNPWECCPQELSPRTPGSAAPRSCLHGPSAISGPRPCGCPALWTTSPNWCVPSLLRPHPRSPRPSHIADQLRYFLLSPAPDRTPLPPPSRRSTLPCCLSCGALVLPRVLPMRGDADPTCSGVGAGLRLRLPPLPAPSSLLNTTTLLCPAVLSPFPSAPPPPPPGPSTAVPPPLLSRPLWWRRGTAAVPVPPPPRHAPWADPLTLSPRVRRPPLPVCGGGTPLLWVRDVPAPPRPLTSASATLFSRSPTALSTSLSRSLSRLIASHALRCISSSASGRIVGGVAAAAGICCGPGRNGISGWGGWGACGSQIGWGGRWICMLHDEHTILPLGASSPHLPRR